MHEAIAPDPLLILCIFRLLLKNPALMNCAFGLGLKIKIISLFSLFLLLFMSPITLFDTIHEPHYTIFQLTFTFIYSTFSNSFFNFSKISGIQTHSKFSIHQDTLLQNCRAMGFQRMLVRQVIWVWVILSAIMVATAIAF